MATQEFGARLRELRKQAGLGQRELANRIGINFTYLSKIESGVMPPPSEKVILRLAEALNVDKDELMALAGRIPGDIAQILKTQKAWQFLRSGRTQRKLRVANRKEGVSIMKNLVNYKRLPRAAIATLLVAAVAASLWFASPTQAVTVTLPDVPPKMYTNQTPTFHAQIVINTNEKIPISKLRLDISGPTPRWAEFNADGTFLSGSSYISMNRTVVPYYGSGTRSGYGYGYRPTIGYGYFTGSWGYGLGYGYGYASSPTSPATYQVTLDTSDMTPGPYTVRFSVITGPGTQSFTSTLRNFTLSPAAEDEEGFVPGFGPSAVVEPGITKVSNKVTSTGKFTEKVTAKSGDKKVELTIEKGTVGLTKSKTALSRISVLEMAEPPAPPKDANIIGLTYDLGPDGATFFPEITLTFTYDPDALPATANEKNLVIAIWDENVLNEDTGEPGAWVNLEGCTVDTATNTITAPISGFTAFAVIAPEAAPAPPAPPAPPKPVPPKPAPPAPAPPKPVPPKPAPPAPAPVPAPTPVPTPEVPPAVNWGLIGGIIGAVVIAGLLVYFLWWRRRTA